MNDSYSLKASKLEAFKLRREERSRETSGSDSTGSSTRRTSSFLSPVKEDYMNSVSARDASDDVTDLHQKLRIALSGRKPSFIGKTILSDSKFNALTLATVTMSSTVSPNG